MTYGDKPLCSTLKSEELEDTFFYRGPNQVREKPSRLTQEHWDQAKEFCIECPVFLRCREQNWGQEYGVWGGTDQYERYLRRRSIRHSAQQLSEERLERLKAYLYARATGPRGLRPEALARETGFSADYINAIVQEHEELREAQQRALKLERDEARDAVGWTANIKWPTIHPRMGDGWVWREGRAISGHYVAQSEDGKWLRMKFRTVRGNPVIRWFPQDEVRLLTEVTPVVQAFGVAMKKRAKREAA